jgi:hypothetical protein
MVMMMPGIGMTEGSYDHDVPRVTVVGRPRIVSAPGWRRGVSGVVTMPVSFMPNPSAAVIPVIVSDLVTVSLTLLEGVSAGSRIVLFTRAVAFFGLVSVWGLMTLSTWALALGPVSRRLLVAFAGFAPACLVIGFPVVVTVTSIGEQGG